MIEHLRELDLEGVAATAAIDAEGNLSAVGGLWEKFGPQLQDLVVRRLIHTLLVADNQDAVPEQYLKPWADKLRVLKAKNLEDVIGKLREWSLPHATVRKEEEIANAAIHFLSGQSLPMNHGYQPLPLLRKLSPEEIRRLREEARERAERERRNQGGSSSPEASASKPGPHAFINEPVIGEYDPKPLSLADLVTGWLAPVGNERRGAVLLTEPGGGKSTLTRRLAWLAATNAEPFRDKRLLPVRVELGKWAVASGPQQTGDGATLADYLTNNHAASQKRGGPTKDTWLRWLERGELFLLLDGLDEAGTHQDFVQSLRLSVEEWSQRMPVVVTCRTMNFGAFETSLSVFKLDGFEREAIRSFVRAYPDGTGRLDPEKLIAHLDRTPVLSELARTPFLLDLICLVATNATELPTRRSELYDQAMNLLLDPQRVPPGKSFQWPFTVPEVSEIRTVLGWAALELMLADPAANSFTRPQLLDGLKHGWEQLGECADVNGKARALRDYVSGPVRLVALGGEHGCFVHRSLMEFLAADCLAQVVNTKGWD